MNYLKFVEATKIYKENQYIAFFHKFFFSFRWFSVLIKLNNFIRVQFDFFIFKHLFPYYVFVEYNMYFALACPQITNFSLHFWHFIFRPIDFEGGKHVNASELHTIWFVKWQTICYFIVQILPNKQNAWLFFTLTYQNGTFTMFSLRVTLWILKNFFSTVLYWAVHHHIFPGQNEFRA